MHASPPASLPPQTSSSATADTPTPSIEERTVGLVRLLQEHQWLAECHLTDFYVQNLWEGLPSDWRVYLDELSIPEALNAASFAGDTRSMHSYLIHTKSNIPCPASLSAFLTGLAGLPLSRVPSRDGHQCCEAGATTLGAGLDRGMTPKKLHEVDRLAKIVWENLSNETGTSPTIVDVGSGLGHLSRVLAIKYGFDVLAVEGDSCHVQSAIHVDSKSRHKPQDSAVNGAGAPEIPGGKEPEGGGTMEKPSQKGRVRHVQFRFGGVGGGQSLVDAIRPLLADVDADADASEEKEENASKEGQDAATSREFVLVGLHACGDLVPQMLEAFKACRDCKAVFAVSCCYMKVTATGAKPTTKRDTTHVPSATSDPAPPTRAPQSERIEETLPGQDASKDGGKATMYLGEGGVVVPYPMSASVSREGCPLGDPESTLGYQMREQACHALEAWTGRAKEEAERASRILAAHENAQERLWGAEAQALTLRNHCWRAVLEKLLAEMASRSPAEWREEGGAGDEEDSLRRCLRLLARGEGKGRLAGVNREKVQKHASFGSYARAVLRRASAASGGGGGSGGGGEVGVGGAGDAEWWPGGLGGEAAKREDEGGRRREEGRRDWVDAELERLEEVDLDAEYAGMLSQWQRPVLFYALRLALAPAIESLLLLDRLLFLRAIPGVSASLLPAFRPALSPRTFLLAAQRRSNPLGEAQKTSS